MEAIAKLIGESPAAGQLLMAMTSRMGHHNALVASYAALQELTGLSRSTVARSMQLLKERRFVSLVQLGQTKSTRAIVINDHVAWYGPRDGLRHSLFSAAVLATSSEQESMDEFENSEPLTEIPAVYKGEHQLPTGEGLPPPSAPSIPGLETPLPTRLEPS
jgi:DNA-binding transcriptional MocR family regulator